MYLLRWVRRYIRKKAYFIDQQTGVNIHRNLSFLYLFFSGNAFLGLIYLTKKGQLDYALDAGLKTEAEASQSKAISTLESLGIEQAKVITMTGFFKIVSEEDYESEDLKRRKEKEKKLAEENVVGDDLV
ncbi:uncharacterized protein LOC111048651 isoform X2 [Nilaparvata lugens]|uniref:uncharacterized protein LOC111048651 isoform X2 n=1 Tax=Nilaparvata lugens TaxID=108931 RepID=UPI000B99605D|nr:uncharacterized protein LOC111048651 isoform X2 [Nilaparvata lugens]